MTGGSPVPQPASRPSAARRATTWPMDDAARNSAGGRPYPGSTGQWWSTTTTRHGGSSPSRSPSHSHSTSTTVSTPDGIDGVAPAYAPAGVTRAAPPPRPGAVAGATASPQPRRSASMRSISGSAAPRIHRRGEISDLDLVVISLLPGPPGPGGAACPVHVHMIDGPEGVAREIVQIERK